MIAGCKAIERFMELTLSMGDKVIDDVGTKFYQNIDPQDEIFQTMMWVNHQGGNYKDASVKMLRGAIGILNETGFDDDGNININENHVKVVKKYISNLMHDLVVPKVTLTNYPAGFRTRSPPPPSTNPSAPRPPNTSAPPPSPSLTSSPLTSRTSPTRSATTST
jgi:hypothetical protein